MEESGLEKSWMKSEAVESEDLLIEILKRLPVKSLLRFKATSKRWYALINSPIFIKSHLASVEDRLLILNHTPDKQFFLFPDPDPNDDIDGSEAAVSQSLNTNALEPANFNTNGAELIFHFTAVFPSCDGIVCLHGGYICEITLPIIPITLWNPATREFKPLPISSYSASIGKLGAQWDVGFGYDSKTDDYKVVTLISMWADGDRNKPYTNYAEVYSLKTNSWRVIDAESRAPIELVPIYFPSTASTYAQGVCYWIASIEEDRVLVSFDMEEEVFRVTQAPPINVSTEYKQFNVLASWNECVYVMYYSTYAPIELWALKDRFAVGGDCWSLEYIVEPPAGFPPMYDLCLHPLGLWKNCLLFVLSEYDIPYYICDEYAKEEFWVYNPSTKEMKNLEFPGRINYPTCYRYKETLVSLA